MAGKTATPGWTTEAAAKEYSDRSRVPDSTLKFLHEEGKPLRGKVADIDIAWPALEAEMRKRGLLR
jgi:hypothetical protein